MAMVVGLVVAVYLFSWLTGLSFVTIKNVSVFGADPDIETIVHDTAMNELSGKYLGLFNKSNTLIYPKTSIVKNIKLTSPRILNVFVSRDGLTGLRVTVNEKTPVAVVCATLPNFDGNKLVIESDDPCYLADDTGFLFQKSPVFTDHPYHIYFAPDISATNISNTDSDSNGDSANFIGAYATTTTEFNTLQTFYNSAQSVGIQGDAILVKNAGEFELYSGSTTIYFNDAKDLDKELANLVAFWNHAKTAGNTDFDYIDLRYDLNVFYKQIEKPK